LHKSARHAKQAVVGFGLGAVIGFTIGVVLVTAATAARLPPVHRRQQTIPILAIARWSSSWVNPKLPGPFQGWGRVAVIAAYLTFFPVAINTLRGLQSADPRGARADAYVRGKPLDRAWKLRVPSSLPYVFLGAGSSPRRRGIVGAIIASSVGLQTGSVERSSTSQYLLLEPQELWATNIVARPPPSSSLGGRPRGEGNRASCTENVA